MRQQILSHCQASLPNEACGFLAEDSGTSVQHFYPIGNDAASPRFFHMNAKDQLKAEKAMNETGQLLAAIVHSHPMSKAFPSETDLKQAHWPETDDLTHPGIPWLLVSLLKIGEPEVRVFQIRGLRYPQDIQEMKMDE